MSSHINKWYKMGGENMKKIILLIFSSVFLVGLIVACSNPKESIKLTTVTEQDVREIAINQLTSENKEIIAGTWQDSKLSKIALNEGMGNVNDKSYIGKEVYLIDFPTKSISIPNNIIVYIGIDNNKLIGYGFVD